MSREQRAQRAGISGISPIEAAVLAFVAFVAYRRPLIPAAGDWLQDVSVAVWQSHQSHLPETEEDWALHPFTADDKVMIR